jgi:hypothetical protein
MNDALPFVHAARAAAVLLALAPTCGGTVETAAGATSGGATTTGPAPAPASVRFANLSPQLPAFDVCTGAGSALLAADGLAAGLDFGQVSRYLPASSGAWAMVAPGGSCASPSAVPLPIAWPAGAEHGRVTVVPWRGAQETTAYAFLDQPENDGYGIDLRVLDFMESPVSGASLYVLHQGDGDTAPKTLFSSLTFAAVPTHSALGAVTPAGFVHTPYLAVGDLTVVPDLYIAPVSIPGDVPIPSAQGHAYGVGSIFLAGGFDGGSARAVVCADDAPAAGALSSCTVLAQAP